MKESLPARAKCLERMNITRIEPPSASMETLIQENNQQIDVPMFFSQNKSQAECSLSISNLCSMPAKSEILSQMQENIKVGKKITVADGTACLIQRVEAVKKGVE